MKNFTPKVFAKQMLSLLMAVALLQQTATAQLRNYGLIYSDNTRGNVQIFGNTLMAYNFFNSTIVDTAAMNGNALTGNTISNYTNGFHNMQYVDVDGNTGVGASTRNSSSSDLVLPAGVNTIKLARLYWGGRVLIGDFDLNDFTNKTIKIRKGTSGAYDEFQAQQIDQFISGNTPVDSSFYQAYVDITDYVKTNGTGTYTVGNAPLTFGVGGNQGNYGGWSIIVVYENPAENFNSIRLYDGFQFLGNFISPVFSTVTLSGLDVPGALSLSDARMGIVTWEGDANSNFNGDYLKINDNTFSNAINPPDNPMNGTISTNGVHITTKNPNYTNQMGIDIDQFDVGTGYGILPGNTAVKLEFGTTADRYFPGVFSFVIKRNEPAVNLSKTVTDVNNLDANAGDTLIYTLRGNNTGAGSANNILVVDTLPSTVTYVANSLKINYSPGLSAGSQTDISGDDNAEFIVNGSNHTVRFRLGINSNGVNGGTIPAADSFVVQFKVTINTPTAGEPQQSIINIARLQGTNDANQLFTDDGIAIINPTVINLPVLLTSFRAALSGNNLVKVNWTTAQEINSKNFDIERSVDGHLFSKIASVSAAGNSSQERNYYLSDNVENNTAQVLYYRLRQIDIDDRSALSTVVSVRLKKAASFTISPNPFSSFININIDWDKNETTTIKLFSVDGRELVSKNVQMIKGTNYIKIDELNKLQAGNYLLQFNNAKGRILKQITKQ